MEITLPPLPNASRLPELISRCKGAVLIDINRHRSYYQKVADALDEEEDNDEIDKDIRQRMIETDTIVRLQFYPLTPIGFYVIFHYDINAAVEQALSILDKRHPNA